MNPEGGESPSDTQQTLSDDELISRSIKPEFYDPDLDEKDELWIQKRRKGQYSDAVLSCPACFTILCLECQRWNYVDFADVVYCAHDGGSPFSEKHASGFLLLCGTGQCKAVNHGMATPCGIDSSAI
ncbi:hypothetical protein RJ639_009252 [Escallonia herrerae]|uniref:E2F-associated phosphoprotein n=1 Tax=Escallonia herrerae TaxID=1293975 RepID=A0AA89AW19_9ASTE|nr:hypothetical protein RJ639_009252 [Escallonia herrerae]